MRDTHHLPPSIPDAKHKRGLFGEARARERRVADPRVAMFADDLRARLRHACCDWSDDDFEDVVLRIARLKVRWSDLDRAD